MVKEACELRMVSDVPVGVFLSGGFDSTMVTSVLQKDRTDKLKTFTIGFPDGIDESKDAEKIAKYLGTDHHTYDCSYKDAMELIPLLPEFYDDPIADISCIPTMLVSKLARQEVTVALTGDGGDELFAGYGGFKTTPEILNRLKKFPYKFLTGSLLKYFSPLFTGKYNHIEKKLSGISRVIQTSPSDMLYQFYIYQSGIPTEFLDKLFLETPKTRHPIKKSVNYKNFYDELFVLGVEDVLRDLLLVKTDRATMGYSLEGREPLLDHSLMEFAATLPFYYKHDGITSKRPIREIVYKYVPKEIMDRPKVGFDLPIYKWLRGELAYLLDEFLNYKALEEQKMFSSIYIEQLIKQFKNGQLRYKSLIWRLLVFEMWYKRWYK